MAVLEKLQLSGIRSFGPFEEDTQQVKFTTPVTLFLGQNGCGKTTIIEAIKFACSGELPGGTRSGQGFVNDPKISGSAVTKGQIRLRLKDVKGDQFTICKSIQVQQKANTLQFSRLDSSVRIKKNNGETREISSRCADIDSYCCQVMNVSPSILNNVIFCHQENSAWPLEEAQKVKKKFDDIFDSAKYNKCSVLLRNHSKEKQIQINHLREAVAGAKEKKESVEDKRAKLQEKKEKLQTYGDSLNLKGRELAPIQERIGEILELEKTLGELNNKLSARIEAKKGVIHQQTLLKKAIIELFEGSDEDLRNELSTFETNHQAEEKLIKAMESQKNEIENEEKQVNFKIQQCQVKVGHLEGEKNMYQNVCSQQEKLFEKAKILLNSKTLPGWDNPETTNRSIKELKSVLRMSETALEDVIAGKKAEELEMQADIDKIREELAGVKENVKLKTKELEDIENKIVETNNQLQELNVSDNKLLSVNKKIDELSKSLNGLKLKVNEDEVENEIRQIREQIVDMETKLNDAEQLYKILQQNYVIEEKLESEKQFKIQRETETNKLKNKHAASLNRIFESNIPDSNLKIAVKAIMNKNDALIKTLNNQKAIKQKDVTTLETQIRHQNLQIDNCKKELEKNKAQIAEVCQGKDFNTLLSEVYSSKEKLQKDKGQYSSAKIMFEKFIEQFENENPCCPVCQSTFTNKKNLVNSIIADLKTKIENVPRNLIITQTNLQRQEELFNRLQQLKPVNGSIELLTDAKLPLLFEELENQTTKFNKVSSELKILEEDLENPSNIVEMCRTIISDVAFLDQYKTEIHKCNVHIKSLEEQINPVNTQKSKHEVESEIDSLKADISDIRKACDTKKLKLDQHKNMCHKIGEDVKKQMELQMKYQTQSQNKPILEKQCENLKEKRTNLQEEISRQGIDRNSKQIKLQIATSKREDTIKMNSKFINEERNENIRKSKIIEEIEKISKDIVNYLSRNVDVQLDEVMTNLTKLQTKKDDLNETKNKTINEISNKKQFLARQRTSFRNLQDNVSLREGEKEEALLVVAINNLQKQIKDFNYRTVYEEKKIIVTQCEKLEREINSLQGQEGELSENIRELEGELEMPKNKNAHKIYLEKYYELEVVRSVMNDINRYTLALEKSILQFHKERMVQINERIRELWRIIYRGNDIDFIEIKTDDTTGTAKKRCYDYRVVQVKNGIELEMRGRCSAGQRVLACLVIRMALAESFSSHCGILALDEPTTNLDKENVVSLTEALANIVNARQNEENFQLIVITHDQEFLDGLRHSVQNISHYWKVSRSEKGYSIIEKERL